MKFINTTLWNKIDETGEEFTNFYLNVKFIKSIYTSQTDKFVIETETKNYFSYNAFFDDVNFSKFLKNEDETFFIIDGDFRLLL